MSLLRRIARKIGLPDQNKRRFTVPRRWSNEELRKVAGHFSGDVINVSAWEDLDKEGNSYRSYFRNSGRYFISNYGTSQGVLQNTQNEIYLDLEAPLDERLNRKFDVVFNHTTLEHVFEFRTAFANLCRLSRDAVIIVVPWLQPLHTGYGDYWRFSPQAVVKLFDENGFGVVKLTWTQVPRAAVYVFAVASREPDLLARKLGGSVIDPRAPGFLDLPENHAGSKAFYL